MSTSRATIQRALDAMNAGRIDQAEAAIRRLLATRPRDADALWAMSRVHLHAGRMDQALHFARSAASASTADPAILNHVGNVLLLMGRTEDSLRAFEHSVAVNPNDPYAHNGLGIASAELGDYAAAMHSLETALRLGPDLYEPNVAYTRLLQDIGRTDELLARLREMIARFPRSGEFMLAHLNTCIAASGVTADQLFTEHAKVGGLMDAAGVKEPAWPASLADPDRVLRVGLVSPDLRNHSVAYFIEPVIERLDRSRFFVACYAYYSVADRPDDVSERLKRNSDLWRDVSRLSDAALAAQIRDDRIDILIDLAGHTFGGRLGPFVLRCAPVRATYLGYAATTGVPAIQYRFVDSITDPPGSDHHATERLIRLDPCFLCYRPASEACEVRPRDNSAPITFGSFNAIRKLTEPAIELWSNIVMSTPDSRLMLKAGCFGKDWVRAEFERRFSRHGLDPARLTLIPFASKQEHFSLYHHLDIALDPFPYNGTTTTCEALLMGVPVVTLRGDRHASRVGSTILSAIGLNDLIAHTPGEYLSVAVNLAKDRDRLATLRHSLRSRLRSSVLCDEHGFSTRFGDTLRELWRDWCAGILRGTRSGEHAPRS